MNQVPPPLNIITATQHSQRNRLYGRPTNVLTFEQWANGAFDRLREHGAKIEVGQKHGVRAFRITKPNEAPMIVYEVEIRADYERVYLKRQSVTA